MVWASVALAVVISLLALAYVIWPIVRSGSPPVLVENDRLTELVGRKDAVLQAIKDLEFDYRVGKLSEEDYQRFDQRLRRQAIGLLQQIEKVAPQSTAQDERLETEIAKLRKAPDPAPPPRQAAAAQEAVAVPAAASQTDGQRASSQQAPATGQAAEPRFCTNCGQPVEPTHKFCAHCGTPLAVPEPAEQA